MKFLLKPDKINLSDIVDFLNRSTISETDIIKAIEDWKTSADKTYEEILNATIES